MASIPNSIKAARLCYSTVRNQNGKMKKGGFKKNKNDKGGTETETVPKNCYLFSIFSFLRREQNRKR